MADKLMLHILPLLQIKLVVETYEHSTQYSNQSKFTKVPKVVKSSNKKTLLQNFGIGVIKCLHLSVFLLMFLSKYYQILLYKVVRFYCLKLQISKPAELIEFSLFWKLYLGSKMVLSYFILNLSLEMVQVYFYSLI